MVTHFIYDPTTLTSEINIFRPRLFENTISSLSDENTIILITIQINDTISTALQKPMKIGGE